MSLFSDHTPLLSLVNLHAPMPDSDDLWHAGSATEWLQLFEKTHGSSYKCPQSLRDFFTSFVNGDFTGKTLSPTQLRLLLHPLSSPGMSLATVHRMSARRQQSGQSFKKLCRRPRPRQDLRKSPPCCNSGTPSIKAKLPGLLDDVVPT